MVWIRSDAYRCLATAAAPRMEPCWSKQAWRSREEKNACQADPGGDSDVVGTLLAALRECSRSKNLRRGAELHRQAISCGHISNKYVAGSLINMYAKCGSMIEARGVFDAMAEQNVVTWNTLLQGYVDAGQCEVALELFHGSMDDSQAAPDSRSYAAVVGACADLSGRKNGERTEWLEKGKALHSQAVMASCCDLVVESILLEMYANCGTMQHARSVFDRMVHQDVVAWTTLLQGYVANGEDEMALEMFDSMEHAQAGCGPNARSYTAAVSACINLAGRNDAEGMGKWLEKGKEIHSRAVICGCCDIFLRSRLIDLYATCGSMLHGRAVFDSIEGPDVISWTALMQGYVQNEGNELALELFGLMEDTACHPDTRAYVIVLTAFSNLASKNPANSIESRRWLENGKAIHSRAVRESVYDSYVENALVELYAKCGSMTNARNVFSRITRPDVVSWTALLQGYVENGESGFALDLFESLEEQGVPNEWTYSVAVLACAALGSKWLEKGKSLHSRAVKRGCCNSIVQSVLVEMYVKCSGNMVQARSVFDRILRRSTMTWNSLVRGYAANGECEAALELIDGMAEKDAGTFAVAIMACSYLSAFERGKKFHLEIQERGLDKDLVLKTCLVEFYGRCGSMDIANKVFDSMLVKDISAWNALIFGYSQQGDAKRVFELFQQLKDQGLVPNVATFNHVLSACSHAGLTEEGKQYFDAMRAEYKLTPDMYHYTCMVDLLGRANHLDEALKFVRDMPVQANGVVWTALLAACKKWNNVEIGKQAFEALVAADDNLPSGTAYVLMANIYRAAGMWNEEQKRITASG